jgi:hypothetical protein
MLGMLSGDDSSARAVQDAIGRTIASVAVEREGGPERDSALVLTFTDGAVLTVWDGGRSCCESRYLTCDDDLAAFAGDTLRGVEVADGPTTEEHGDPHETAFLKVRTDRGVITATTHNEHNGYYGGFWFRASLTPTPTPE